MSYNLSTTGKGENEIKVISMVCNTSGCKAVISTVAGEKKGELNVRARLAGWRGLSATEHHCPAHSAKRGDKKAEGKTVTKTAVAQTKAEKVTGKAGKASKSAPATKKSQAPVTSFVGGQSIGKTARSAKKSS